MVNTPVYVAPRRQPGYREYEGPRNRLVQAWDTGKRYHGLETIGASFPPVAGNPCLIYDAKGNQHYLAYRDGEGHIHEATLNEGAWQLTDLTALAGAPPTMGDLSGLVSTLTGCRYYVYRSFEGHLHQLCFDGSWSYRSLSAAITK